MQMTTRNSSAHDHLTAAIEQADSEAVRRIVGELGAQLPKILNDGDGTKRVPPLFLAVTRGNRDIVTVLLDAGADIEIRNATGRTPLYEAYVNADSAMAELLIARGADIRARNQFGTRILDIALVSGDMAAVQRFVAAGETLQYVNDEGRTTLHRACTSSNIELIRLVLDRTNFTLDREDNHGVRPVDSASSEAGFEYCLLQHPGLERNHLFVDGDFSIHRFAREGRREIVAHLLDNGVDLHLPGRDKSTVLHNAVVSGDRELVKLLLERGANIEARNSYSFRPLHWAAESGDLEMIKLLLERGARLDVKTSVSSIIQEMHTPLYTAIDKDHDDVAKYLIERGADPNTICDTSHGTPFIVACSRNKVELVRLMLAHGASPNGINEEQSTRIDYFYFPLGEAGSAEVIDLLVAAGADVNARDRYQSTALHKQVSLDKQELNTERGRNRLAAIRALILHGADINAPDMNGRTPQSNARAKQVTEILLEARKAERSVAALSAPQAERQMAQEAYRRLVETMAGVARDRDELPSTPGSGLGKELFDRSHHCGEPDAMESLLVMIEHATSEDVNYISPDGYDNSETILHRVIESAQKHGDDTDIAPLAQFERAVELLVEREARVDAVETLYHETPLHKVCRASMTKYQSPAEVDLFKSMLCRLLERGADINAQNENGSTALDFVKHAALFVFLRERGARFGEVNEALFYAMDFGDSNEFRTLVEQGVELDVRNSNGDTPLLHAARGNNVEQLKMLLAMGADRKARGKAEVTALHVACSERAYGSIRYLLDGGAPDLNAQDDAGRVPLSYLLQAYDKSSWDAEIPLLMVRTGARIDIKDHNGSTPLDYAPTKKMAAALKKAALEGADAGRERA